MLIDASFHAAVEKIMSRAAETAILPRLGKLLVGDIHEKAADELVTIADRESERILASGLQQLLPEAAIVGEEAADADPSILAKLDEELCWVIDPLDGTANFADGTGPFGILIALASKGAPVGGWLYDPRSRRFCAAATGSGAFINGERAIARPSLSDPPIAAVSSFLSRTGEGRVLVEKVAASFSIKPIPRCAAEQYPAMVLGQSDVTIYWRTLPWDHAAGVLFLTESGGIATRLDGSPYRLTDNRAGLVAAVDEGLWRMTLKAVEERGSLQPSD